MMNITRSGLLHPWSDLIIAVSGFYQSRALDAGSLEW
jgi:hypothetical protein